MIQTVPSFQINEEIVFGDFDNKVSMGEEDLTLNEKCSYLKRAIKEITRENLYSEILSKVNINIGVKTTSTLVKFNV